MNTKTEVSQLKVIAAKQRILAKYGQKVRIRREHLLGLIKRIKEVQHHGKIFVEESGRDCDQTVYSGRIHVIDANLNALRKLDNEIGEWADGPYQFCILTKEEADETRYYEWDQAAEMAGY